MAWDSRHRFKMATWNNTDDTEKLAGSAFVDIGKQPERCKLRLPLSQRHVPARLQEKDEPKYRDPVEIIRFSFSAQLPWKP